MTLKDCPELRNGVVSYESDVAARSGRPERDWIEAFDGTDGAGSLSPARSTTMFPSSP